MKDAGGLAARYLRAHLKRTILTVLGVVLSVALVCASGLFGQSIVDKGIEEVRLGYGAFHATVSGLTRTQVDQLEAHAKAAEVGCSVDVGYAALGDSISLGVIGADAGFQKAMHIVLASGRLPAGPGEIAVESWLGSATSTHIAVGSRLDLPVMVVDPAAPSGLPRPMALSFTVTGLLEGWNLTQAQGRGLGLVSLSQAERIQGTSTRYTAGFVVRGGLPVQKTIAEIRDALGVDAAQLRQNTPLLTAMGVGTNPGYNRSIRNAELIIAFIILIATVAVISNIFSISVLERMRQLGILRSIGATPGQLRALIMREALVVSAVGIPLGIASGVLAAQVVIWVFRATSGSFFGGLSLTLQPSILAGSAGLGVLVVFLSALGPSLRAARVSPLEAVMAPSRTAGRAARRRRHRLMTRLFGVAGKMAGQNLVRNRKRFFVTVGSITIGVSLFITFASLLGMLLSASGNLEAQPFHRDVAVYARGFGPDKELGARELAAVRATAGVRDVLATREANGLILPPDAAPLPAAIMGLSPSGLALFRSHVVEGRFDPGRMDRDTGAYVTRSGAFRIGDTILVQGSRAAEGLKPVAVKVLGFIDSLTWSPVLDRAAIGMVVSDSVFTLLTGKDSWTRFDIGCADKGQSAVVAEALRASPVRARGARVEDFTASERGREELIVQISVLLYGLVTVISLIGALNIVNTIGTSLILRVREFGMLRAVGMTGGQIRGMVALEGLLYGLYAAVPGSAIGLFASWLLFTNVGSVQAIPLEIPWVHMIAACLAATAIGVLSALIPLRRIGRASVVESVRAEE